MDGRWRYQDRAPLAPDARADASGCRPKSSAGVPSSADAIALPPKEATRRSKHADTGQDVTNGDALPTSR